VPIEWSAESHHAKELSKWNRPKRDGGMNANGYEPFPKMLYKAQQNPISGKYEVAMHRDVISLDKTVVLLSAEQFNSSCQLTVQDGQEYERARAEGWRDSQAEAMEYHERLLDEVAQAAAYRASEDSKMGEKARAEAKAAEEATDQHVAEVKQKPTDRMAAARAAKAAKAAKKAQQQGA
jgi:hypothetical protein